MASNNKGSPQTGPLDCLIEAMELLRDAFPDLTVTSAMAFLRAAKNPGLPMSELQKAMAVPQSTLSRTVAVLSKYAAYQKEGANLLVAEDDPKDRRQRVISLTPKGEKLAEKLTKTLDN